MHFDERQRACMRAALMYWAREGMISAGHERDVATGEGEFEELTVEEVDALRRELENDAPEAMSAMADKADQVVQCFSRNGEFNSHSAPLGTQEVREVAVQLRDYLTEIDKHELLASVMMQDVIGEYDTPDKVPEWTWVEANASYAHLKNAEAGVWEFVLNLSRTFEDIPKKLVKVIARARNAGCGYIMFHQGT